MLRWNHDDESERCAVDVAGEGRNRNGDVLVKIEKLAGCSWRIVHRCDDGGHRCHRALRCPVAELEGEGIRAREIWVCDVVEACSEGSHEAVRRWLGESECQTVAICVENAICNFA